MNTKQQNWQPLIQATENLLADFPDMLSTILQTWQDHAPISPPSIASAPVSKASASASKGFFFFFFE